KGGKAIKRPILFGILATVIVLIGLLAAGPQRITLAEENTGDEELAQKLRDNAGKAQNRIAAFTFRSGSATFAGLGANEHTEVEIGSVTKTFTTDLLRQQVESKEITLDTTVGDIIDVHGSEVADVTMLELADHTSGLPRLDQDNLGLMKKFLLRIPIQVSLKKMSSTLPATRV